MTAFLRAYFRSVCFYYSFESGGEILKFCFATFHEVNVIYKAKVAQRPSSDGSGGMEVVESPAWCSPDIIGKKIGERRHNKP